MKFGIAIPSSHQGTYLPTPFAKPAELLKLVQLAERLGFQSAWGLDFMTTIDDRPPPREAWPEWYEILTTLAFLAAGTSRIRLGSASLQLPLRDPFLVARQAATIDVLSNGRLMLGVGLGFKRIEFERLRPRNAKIYRGRLFEESLAVMRRFFKEGAVTFDGEYYACKDADMLPKPIQNPFPIYMSGITDDVFDRIAKYSAGWLLTRIHLQPGTLEKNLVQLESSLEKAGRRLDEIDIVTTIGLSLGATREQGLQRFHDSILPARMDGMAARQGMTGRPSQDLNQVLLANLIGTPDDVIEQIRGIQKRGMTHIVLYYNPVKDIREMSDQIQWFGESVLPKLES